METMILFFILVIVVITFSIMLYNNAKKSSIYSNKGNDKTTREILQEILEVIGENLDTRTKVDVMNTKLINRFRLDFSTLCIYNGNEYNIASTNVEQIYKEAISKLPYERDFAYNIQKLIPKHMTSDIGKTLLYKTAIERNVKNALFLPICYNDKIIAFWLAETSNADPFKHITDSELVSLNKALGVLIRNIKDREIIEMAEMIDKQTGFFNTTYLYSNFRNIFQMHEKSSFGIISLVGLPRINEVYNRNVGNILLAKLANSTKEVLPEETTLIRYDGLKILAIIPGETAQSTQKYFEKLLSKYKTINENVDDNKVSLETQILLHTVNSQNNVEESIQKMNSYIEWMNVHNTIKII